MHNSKKTFIVAERYAGYDWHDSHYESWVISDKVDFSLDDPCKALVEDVLKAVPISVPDSEFQVIVKKINDLEDGATLNIVLPGEKCDGQDENIIIISKNNNKFDISVELYYGQYEIGTTYFINEIPESDLIYVPIKRAYAGSKPINSCDFLLHFGFKNPISCRHFLEKEKKNGTAQTFKNYPCLNDAYLIIPFKISELMESAWYKDQLTILTKSADELLDIYKKEWENSNQDFFKSIETFVYIKHLAAYKKIFNK